MQALLMGLIGPQKPLFGLCFHCDGRKFVTTLLFSLGGALLKAIKFLHVQKAHLTERYILCV